MSKTHERLGLGAFIEELPDEASYLAAHPQPVLLVEPSRASFAVSDANGETQHGDAWDETASDGTRRIDPEAQVAWLEKTGASDDSKAVTVGRSRKSDVVLRHGEVSKRHAALRPLVQDLWVIEDLGTTNGTFVDEVPVPASESLRLQDGARIRFGTGIVATFFSPASFWAFCSHVRDQSS